MITAVHKMSSDIGMSFGTSKCKTVKVIKGKLTRTEPINLNEQTIIEPMGMNNTYKYLGITQTNRIEHQEVKTKLLQEFENRMRRLLRTRLNAGNLTKAINTYAIPTLAYSFGVINWTTTDLEQIDRKIRTLLTQYHMHHPRASVERVHLPRKNGGQGIQSVKMLHYNQIDQMRKYFYNQEERSGLHAAIIANDHNLTPLKLKHRQYLPLENTETINDMCDKWASKELHGRFYNVLQSPHVDKEASVSWLVSGQIFPETEGFLLSIQDNVVNTKNYRKYIIKDQTLTSDDCRKCGLSRENIEHIISGCPQLAGNKYLERHNLVATIVYLEILKKYGLKNESELPYYKYKAAAVVENENTKIYWDKGIITDREVIHNRPDITIINTTEKSVIFIDISVPNNNNITDKYREKIEKYSDLSDEVLRMWDVAHVRVVPVIISAMGVIPKTLMTSLTTIGIPSNTYLKMQKAVLISTSSIVRSFLKADL